MKTPILKKDLPGCPVGTKGKYSDNKSDIYYSFPSNTDLRVRDCIFTEEEINRNPDFFEWQEEPKFKVGDWVWDAHLERAEKIRTEHTDPQYSPSLDWIWANPKRYPRLATEAEIKQATEKEDLIHSVSGHTWYIGITHKTVIFGIGEISVSELKRIVSIAENFQPK